MLRAGDLKSSNRKLDYEVDYFAKKHSISKSEAEQLIKQYGNNRVVLDQEAEKLKR